MLKNFKFDVYLRRISFLYKFDAMIKISLKIFLPEHKKRIEKTVPEKLNEKLN